MKSISKISVLLLATFTLSTASAGVLIEPYLGAGLGTGDQGSLEYTHSGIGMGARLGYQFLGLMAGFHYGMQSLSVELDGPAATVATHTAAGTAIKSDVSATDMGVFVGYELPILLRAWVGYSFKTEWEFDNASALGASGDSQSGKTTSLGVGFTGLPFVSLNVEYKMISFDEYESATGTSALSPSEDHNQVFFSVSLPLDL